MTTSTTADDIDDLVTDDTDKNDPTLDHRVGLLRAVEDGDVERVEYYLKKGVSPNAKYSSDETTPLHLASENGHEAVAALLLENGAEVNAKDKYGRTPLHFASEYGYAAVARLLLQNGAAVNAQDNDGRTPLHWGSMDYHEAVAALLLENGADINAKDNNGSTPLHKACYYGREAVAGLLLKKGAEVYAKDDSGSTPLHEACMYGHEAVARLLLEKGTEVNAKDMLGWTPLHGASTNGYAAVAAILLEKGAEVNARDDDGWTPLHFASRNGHKVVATLLLEKGAEVNAEDLNGQTPLHGAGINGQDAVAALLLEWGAELHARDMNGRTPLDWARLKNQKVTAKLLLKWGAEGSIGDDSSPQRDGTDEHNTEIHPNVEPLEFSQDGTEEVVAAESKFNPAPMGAVSVETAVSRGDVSEHDSVSEDDAVSDAAAGSNKRPRKKHNCRASSEDDSVSTDDSVSELTGDSNKRPRKKQKLENCLHNCRAAIELLQTQPATAAINKSLKLLLHDMEKDLSCARQVVVTGIQLISGAAERPATTSPASRDILRLDCRTAIQLHEIRMSTPTAANIACLQLVLNEMEKNLSQLAHDSIVATRIDAQSTAEATTVVAESASNRDLQL